MKIFLKSHNFQIFLGIAALAASLLAFTATPAGAGLTNDSAAYIGGARSIVNGTGYSDIWLLPPYEPITHYPPLYSLTLAAGGFLGIDPLRGARGLNILLFGLNTLITGSLVWLSTRRISFSLWATLIFILTVMFLRVHIYAMSEALFLTFMLGALFTFRRYSLEPSNTGRWLLALLSAAAILTRYSGLALVPSIALGLCFLSESWQKRISATAQYVILTIFFTLPWFIRNSLIAGNVTNRSWEFHPITRDNLDQGIYNLSRLFIPLESFRQPIFRSGVWEWFLALVFFGLCLASIVYFIHLIVHKRPDPKEVFTFTLLVAFVAYFLAIFFSMSFFDNSTKLQDRIIAPGYLLLLLYLVISVERWLRKDNKWKSFTIGILALITLGFSISATITEMNALRSGGVGYASWKYRDNPVILVIKDLPEEITVFTNSPPAVYLAADRATQVFPTALDPVSNTLRSDYPEKLSSMFGQINNGDAVLALFNTNDLDLSGMPGELSKYLNELSILKKGGDAVLFSK